MLKHLLLALLIVVPVLLKAQQITGRVLRINSDTVINNASVYFGGSVKGTSTNAEGQFTLPAKQTNIPLVVSCVGYYSTLVTDYTLDKPITVYLKPKINLMREVMIGSDGMSRQEKLRIFKREFIGISDYALSCTITNTNDIELSYDRDSETLTAFCNTPIIIKNKSLAYTINYYLDKFTRSNGHVVFAGNYLFKEEDKVTNPSQLKNINFNREYAYSGSRMQFIRALWNNTLAKNGFEVYDNHYKSLTADSVVYTNPKAEKYVAINRTVRIAYRKDYTHATYLSKRQPLSFIDKDGFFGAGLNWAGKMSSQRIGDMLPFEYVSPQDEGFSIK
jgi:hypothetical protein